MQIERELKEKEIVALFDALAVRFQAISEINLYLANRFNVFNYVSPDESKLSDIIRDLLDPQGDHGQGDLFLNIFLRLLKPDAVKMIGRCAVNREELTRYATNTQRRIDLLLELDGFGIGIENKPWAGEQPGWVKDYSDHLSRRFNGNYLLVFLTRTNREPSKDDARACKELANNFKTIYYEQEFKYWLEESSRNCRADKVRRFVTDFIEYV